MTRKKLINAVRKAARNCGYNFHSGMEYRINSELGELPAVWLSPPTLIKTDGFRAGIKHYLLNLKTICECIDHTPEKKEKAWEEMEADVIDIIRLLNEDEDMGSVYLKSCQSAEFNLTNRGELSLSVELSLNLPFEIKTNPEKCE